MIKIMNEKKIEDDIEWLKKEVSNLNERLIKIEDGINKFNIKKEGNPITDYFASVMTPEYIKKSKELANRQLQDQIDELDKKRKK